MLVLNRKVGQQIIISSESLEPITLMVGATEGEEVKLMLKAPPEIKIDRQESRKCRGVES